MGYVANWPQTHSIAQPTSHGASVAEAQDEPPTPPPQPPSREARAAKGPQGRWLRRVTSWPLNPSDSEVIQGSINVQKMSKDV